MQRPVVRVAFCVLVGSSLACPRAGVSEDERRDASFTLADAGSNTAMSSSGAVGTSSSDFTGGSSSASTASSGVQVPDAGTPAPTCRELDGGAACAYRTLVLDTGLGVLRDVHFQLPEGTAPDAGWPVVVYYQGSFFSGELAFEGADDGVFGEASLTRTIAALLEDGYAVLAPEALGEGSTAWQTNVPPAAFFWEGTWDDNLVDTLLESIAEGAFGPLDATRLYAMGISSGGFMTSRMAVSYPGRFRALAIHSASYATCSALCVLPALPQDHPPTLFLHGELDAVVPLSAMTPYAAALADAGVEVRTVLDADAGHEWLRAGPREIPVFFTAH